MRKYHSVVWVGAVAAIGVGCTGVRWHPPGDGAAGGPPQWTAYESDNPGSPQARLGGGIDRSGEPAPSPSAPGAEEGDSSSKGGADAGRAIEEADIVQFDGSRLYAFSRTGGLSVIDVGTRDQLRLLGTWQGDATPFELYVRGSVVVGLFNGWGKYVTDAAGNTSWVTTSEIVAIDTSDPTRIRTLGTYELPGEISDSRIVGNVLYTVAFQNGYCWKCQTAPTTTVVSLNLADPNNIALADSLSFVEAEGSYSWQRSVTVTAERMFVAGPMYVGGSSQPEHSIVQIVDITNPNGQLALGASVELVGQIDSRWQMDETDHVLRVVSQPGQWDARAVPVIQTFNVTSSNEVTPLGLTAMALPRPERLQSVRFDGARAYAITSERTDPLFTIDLSNPANPQQVGALEMPGWIYFMVPRGNRVLGLGYDQNNTDGSLTVSLFDVSNLAAPSMLDRVNFGGRWGALPEDQDRIHKAFNVLDDLALITVPYGGYQEAAKTTGYTCGSYVNAVQLIDWVGDDLVLRGKTPQKGDARRAFYRDERLFTVSEERVETFDIANRDDPLPKASLPLVLKVNRTLAAGDKVVRFRTDYLTGAVSLEVVPASEPDARVPLGSLDLASALFPELAQAGVCSRYYGWNDMPAFANGNAVYLVVDRSAYASYYRYAVDKRPAEETPNEDENETEVAVIDISNPAAPTLVATKAVASPKGYSLFRGSAYASDGPSILAPDDQVAQSGSTVVVQRRAYEYTTTYSSITDVQQTDYSEKAVLEVFDLAAPANIGHQRVDLGDAMGFAGIRFAGDLIVGSHWVPSPTNPDKIRFYMHLVDVANPASPVVQPSVNVPGSLLEYDPASGHALLVDYARRTVNLGTSSGAASPGPTPSTGPVARADTRSSGSSGTAKKAAFSSAARVDADEAMADGNAEPVVLQPYEICYSQYPNAAFDSRTGVCTWYDRTLNLVAIVEGVGFIIDTRPFPEGGSLRSIGFGRERVFLVMDPNVNRYRRTNNPITEPVFVRVLNGVVGGQITVGETLVASDSPWGWSGWLSVEATGQRALLGDRSVQLVDAADPVAPHVRSLGTVRNWPEHVMWLDADRAVLSLGDYGLQVANLN